MNQCDHLKPSETGLSLVVRRGLSTKLGLFLAVKDKMTALARKRGVFMAAERADKKRDTLERMSLIFGVEQGGTVEKPWPPVAS